MHRSAPLQRSMFSSSAPRLMPANGISVRVLRYTTQRMLFSMTPPLEVEVSGLRPRRLRIRDSSYEPTGKIGWKKVHDWVCSAPLLVPQPCDLFLIAILLFLIVFWAKKKARQGRLRCRQPSLRVSSLIAVAALRADYIWMITTPRSPSRSRLPSMSHSSSMRR